MKLSDGLCEAEDEGEMTEAPCSRNELLTGKRPKRDLWVMEAYQLHLNMFQYNMREIEVKNNLHVLFLCLG